MDKLKDNWKNFILSCSSVLQRKDNTRFSMIIFANAYQYFAYGVREALKIFKFEFLLRFKHKIF